MHYFIRFILLINLVFLSVNVLAQLPLSNEEKVIREFLSLPEDQVDLLEVTLAFEKVVNPALDTVSVTKQISQMADDIRGMLETIPKSQLNAKYKFLALRTYLYDQGEWNNHKVFSYNLDDPLGRDFETRLLSNYLRSREGNCVSMPLLFVILGQKIGLDVTLSITAHHHYAQYKDANGQYVSVETTSGAKPISKEYLMKSFDVSPVGIENGAYMQPLSQRENIVVIASLLMDYYLKKANYRKTSSIANLLLTYKPDYIYAITRKSNSIDRVLVKEFESKYSSPMDMPPHVYNSYRNLEAIHHELITMAKQMGWKSPTRNSEEEYLKKIADYKQQSKDKKL